MSGYSIQDRLAVVSESNRAVFTIQLLVFPFFPVQPTYYIIVFRLFKSIAMLALPTELIK